MEQSRPIEHLNIHEIYNRLLAGKVIRIGFYSQEEAEKFRVRLAQYKLSQDKQMIEIGLMAASERQRFSFTVQGELLADTDFPLIATMMFKDKLVSRQYEVIIVQEGEGSEQ